MLYSSLLKVRSHTSVLGTLSRLFSSLLSSLPPTVGASLLTISLPDVTKEAVEGLLVLYRQEWGEAKVRRDVVELADMLAMPLGNSEELQKSEKDVRNEKEVKETVPAEADQGESGVEDNSDDESVEREPAKVPEVRKIKVEREEVLGPKIKIEIDQIFGNIPAKRVDKKKNRIDELFKNLEMKLQTKRTALKANNVAEKPLVVESPASVPEEPCPKCSLCDFMFLSKEELRIHIGEVHLDKELEAQLVKIFPAGCEDKCDQCGQIVETEYVKKEHILVEHPWTALVEQASHKKKSDETLLEDYNEDEVFFEDESSDEEEMTEKVNIEKKSESGTGRKKWYDGTVYKCNHCNRGHASRGGVKGHVKKKHGFLPGDDLSNQFTKCGSPYTCKICGRSVDWTCGAINQHMNYNHRISLAKYGDEYETKYDDDQISLKRKRRALNSFVKIKKLKVEEEDTIEEDTVVEEDTKDIFNKEDTIVRESIEFSDSSGDEEEN